MITGSSNFAAAQVADSKNCEFQTEVPVGPTELELRTVEQLIIQLRRSFAEVLLENGESLKISAKFPENNRTFRKGNNG